MKSGFQVADQIGELEIVGNIVPHLWYKNITFSSGKTHFVAITVLADIVYWYRPTMIKDESGMIVGDRTKFKGDMLQKSYQAFADFYGFTKRQVKDAIDFLVDHHLLLREFRTISSSSILLNNVMYLQPVACNVRRVMNERINVAELSICLPTTTERKREDVPPEGPSTGDEKPPTLERKTNTESSSTSTSDNKINDDHDGGVLAFFVENGFGKIGSYIENKIKSWCGDLSNELVIEAMKRSIEKGKVSWGYAEAILRNWLKDGVLSLNGVWEKDAAFKSKNKRISIGRKPIRAEVLPEWFGAENDTVCDRGDYDFEMEKAKLQQELEAFAKS
ncbi:DnaD domain protein [Bacillus sp. BHET2]|uniref:DnaD domain-containing protein n=1 Tax=Bacillus sp. BHET2 TaxID=2583818 RepID=UPI00110EFAD7|nr:DnaD domain protein [Bacillus sp. BHET2]TMU83442.1 DnaD domain protein [Bacillus sp. BHET2]